MDIELTQSVFDTVTGWFDQERDQMNQLSDAIWNLAELSYEEKESAKVLMEELSSQGFTVRQGIKDLPTAFVAEWSNGEGAVIGLLGEYDALPGLGYEVADVPKPKGKSGHGCGHNLLGVGSLSAAIAAKTAMQKLGIHGTVRYYGCPAEEDCGAKVIMTHEGEFDDLDAIFRWHPQNFTYVSMASTLTFNSIRYRFHGKSAHAQTFPHLGKSALNAVTLMDHAVNCYRQQLPERHIRIASVISNGGRLPTIVPDEAEIWYMVSAARRDDSDEIVRRLGRIAKGIAIATDTTVEVEYGSACSEILPNAAMSDVVLKNLKKVGPPKWTAEEEAFAAKIDRETTPQKKATTLQIYGIRDPHAMETALYDTISDNMLEGGVGLFSTDSADPSWVVPTGSLFVASMPIGAAVHSWQLTVCAGMSIGKKAMEVAGKTLALCVLDAMTNPECLAKAKAEHEEKLLSHPYVNPLDRRTDDME